jgi:hypothetical protein
MGRRDSRRDGVGVDLDDLSLSTFVARPHRDQHARDYNSGRALANLTTTPMCLGTKLAAAASDNVNDHRSDC